MEEDNKEDKKAILSNIRTVVVAALSLSENIKLLKIIFSLIKCLAHDT